MGLVSKGVVLVPTTKIGLTAERTAQLFLDNVYTCFGLPDTNALRQGTTIRLRVLARTMQIPRNQVKINDSIPSTN